MKLAIVILNWNGEKFLKSFFPQLVKATYSPGSEIIVADNGSTDNSIEWLKSNFPNVRLICFDSNYGFTGGYNKALKEVDAEYFVLLNSDVFVPIMGDHDWTSPIIDFMDSNPAVAICQPKILSEARREFFEYAGAAGGFIDKYGFPFCRGRVLSDVEVDKGQYDSNISCFWASGACMFVRSSVWRELNGLDDLFFAHMEEIDFCWRAQLKGYQVWCIPQSYVYHVGGGTLPNNSPRKLFLNYRNNLLMLYKNLPPKGKGQFIFKRMCIDGLSGIVYLLQGKPKFTKSVIDAHNDFRRLKMQYPAASINSNNACNLNGVYKHSIILSFFIGKKTFRRLFTK